MISPRSAHLIIKHFDSIDKAVSKKTTRKRPWLEPAITSYFCDLMDEDTQLEENLTYTLTDLNQDLSSPDGLLDMKLEVKTHEYPPEFERYVSQADVGLIVHIDDYLLPQNSYAFPTILQAKRVMPGQRMPLRYTETSRVGSFDSLQYDRMKKLDTVLGGGFVKFIFFGPRPEFLDELTRLKLLHLRRNKLAQEIFDYVLGMEIHAELDRAESSLSAGLFIAGLELPHPNLGEIHGKIFGETIPLSWYIVSHFFSAGPHPAFDFLHRRYFRRNELKPDRSKLACGVVTGDIETISTVLNQLGEADQRTWPVLPKHTLEVRLGVGSQLNSDERQIRLEL